METVTAEYNGAQKDVLSVMETAWDNYGLHIEKLSLNKPTKYVPALKGEAKDRIKAARALPDLQARNGKAEELRIDVKKAAADCLQDFQLLKGYIEEAFKGDNEDKRKPNFEEAGQEYYRDASREDWESVQSLTDSMKLYISEKLGVLTTDGDMPALF